MRRMLRGILFLTIVFGMLFFSCAYADSLSDVTVDSSPLVTNSTALDGMVRGVSVIVGEPVKFNGDHIRQLFFE